MKKLKIALIILCSIISLLFLIIIGALIINGIKTNNLKKDYSYLKDNDNYSNSIVLENTKLVKQEISCGYATIEMFAKFLDDDSITEKSLYDEYKSVVTSTGKSFENEMNKRFTNYQTKMYKYLKEDELLIKVYDSLKNGIPVPFEWAALYNDSWTLHYSLIYGIDIKGDLVYILNPYGYKEELSIDSFLERTSFKAYKNMPFYFNLAFAFGIFEKNTIFIVNKK